MKYLALLLVGLLFSAGATSPIKRYYADIAFKSPVQVRELIKKGFDVAGVDYERRVISVVVAEDGLSKFRDIKVLAKREIGSGPDPEYKTPEQVETILQQTEADYPDLATVEVIGKTNENRNLYAINLTSKFVDPGPQGKPAILFDALHHAREVMTVEVALDIVEYLTSNYRSDHQVRKWLDHYSIWVVPMVNPDGSHKVWTSDSMWRKNTRGGYGVDINRNYPYDWAACNGSSSSQSNETYHGASGGSEPETQALMGLAKRIKPVINLSYHSYSEIVIYPYGCSPKTVPSPDNETYLSVGKELAGLLKRDSGSGSYEAGTSYELLYDVDGGSIDWHYAENKTKAYVIEMNGSMQGFQPSYKDWRDRTVEKQRKGWQFLLSKVQDFLE